MRNLLWKDLRQNGRMLLGVGIIASIPYAIGLTVSAWERVFWSSSITIEPWAFVIMGTSFMSMTLTILLAAFIGGNAIAGERSDRSAEFAAGLPIPRGRAATSKVVVSSFSCLFMWAINAAILGVAFTVSGNPRSAPLHQTSLLSLTWTCLEVLLGVFFLFGLSWLYSSLLSSPAISAAAAIGTALGFCLILQWACDYSLERADGSGFQTGFLMLMVIVGAVCLIAGYALYVKRVEP